MKTAPRLNRAPSIAEGGLKTHGRRRETSPEKPLITVVTAVLNGETYLEQTILSVLNQTYGNIEYIVVDGGSVDGSVDIIRKYENRIDYWVSDKDNGISDAFNKGISLASGELIGIINSDDCYETDAVETVVNHIGSIASFSYGHCTYIKEDGSRKLLHLDAEYSKKITKYMPHIHHPTVFVRREAYQEYGVFSCSYKYAMDYDFLLRLHRAGCVGTPLYKNIAYSRTTGVSNKEYLRARNEVRKISIEHGLNPAIARSYYLLFMLAYKVKRVLGIN